MDTSTDINLINNSSMADKVQKIKEFLIGMASAACCDAKTKKNIETIILPFVDSLQEEPVSEDLEEAAFDYAEACKYEGGEKLLCIEHFKAGAKRQKEKIIKKLCNHANIDQMVEKFEDKYKPKKVLDTEYYKRGIFDTIKTIKED